MAEPLVLSSSNSQPRGWTSRAKSLQNPELIVETWAPESINAVTFCLSMITGASLDHPTRWATGSGFKNGTAGAVSHGPVCQAGWSLSRVRVGMHRAYCWLGWLLPSGG